jgi:formylglycine-generating enzyme required for sulfatase activity
VAIQKPASGATKGTVWVPGGTFRMGSDDWYPEERPVHSVAVDGFWVDEHLVTVAEFRRCIIRGAGWGAVAIDGNGTVPWRWFATLATKDRGRRVEGAGSCLPLVSPYVR